MKARVQFNDFGVIAGEDTVTGWHSSVGSGYTVISSGNRNTSSAKRINNMIGKALNLEVYVNAWREKDATLHYCRMETMRDAASSWWIVSN